MILALSPAAGLPGAPETTITVTGDVLTVDGIAYDLSAIPEGGEGVPDGDHPFLGAIRRDGGTLYATLLVQFDAATCMASQPRDPAIWTLDVAAGDVTLPVTRKPMMEP